MKGLSIYTDFTSATKSNSLIAYTTTSPAVRLISYPLAWEAFKLWYDNKYYPLNEKRFLASRFETQQGFLISYLKKFGIDLYVYWESKSEVWVACVNSNQEECSADYDTTLLEAITKGFQLVEHQSERQSKAQKVA